MADQFDDTLIQRLSKMPPGTRTKEQDAYLNDYCKAASITSDTTGTNASKNSTISLRASSINLSALSSNARIALERSMEGVEDRWNRCKLRAADLARSRASTVVRNRPNATAPSEATSRTTVRASGEPPSPNACMPLDEIARLGTGTAKETDREFRELIDEMVAAQKTLSENDTKQRYFFFSQQKKNKDSGSK
ncbi:uncharacterized protein NECHADRAFT_87963 [Fusarium vanettenii 77-13-4]|uniref:Uncharacterized protein n=1 Tax=Fusarium vanettenii (strain ATCC MYA-4622 / CBS 123669 / FGSC 9596 / NRRL 45880 / 77-13-4) TaxID=660122 RepID=C7ZJX0_FUSV7|nr:uncharacterized protein NECHADRAFT_87963 [Fusarium vanettenii 77-13-4]EEU35706.1 predicted protein [Fusarium vanettenii 77-13-4]